MEAIINFAKKTVKVSELKLKKVELEAKKDSLIHDLGNVVYSSYPSIDIESIRGIMDKIIDVETEQENLETAIQEAKGMKICPACGAAMNMNMSFCGNCGTKFEEPEPEAEAEKPEETEEKEVEAAEDAAK